MEIENKSNLSRYNGFHTKSGNFIWGGAMNLCWNQLK
jgi:hypothetical protein